MDASRVVLPAAVSQANFLLLVAVEWMYYFFRLLETWQCWNIGVRQSLYFVMTACARIGARGG